MSFSFLRKLTYVFKSGIIKMIELIKYLLKGENYEKKIKYVS